MALCGFAAANSVLFLFLFFFNNIIFVRANLIKESLPKNKTFAEELLIEVLSRVRQEAAVCVEHQ